MPFSEADLLAYLRSTKLATVSSIGMNGGPQAALVGIGVTDDLRIIFDTMRTSRKHENLLRDPRIAVVVGGPGEQTLQYEGIAYEVPVAGAEGQELREAYYLSWPSGRERATWPDLVYWCIQPKWARYSDYSKGPLIEHFFVSPAELLSADQGL